MQSFLNFIFIKKDKFVNSIKIILIIKLLFLFCECEKLLLKFSEITLTIRGLGNLKILSDKFFEEYKPYEIYVNDSSFEIKNEFFYNNK